jgi:amino acid permease
LSQSSVTVMVTIFPALPLSLLKTMGALRFSSLFAVACVSYLCVVVVAKYYLMCSDHTIVHSIDRAGVAHEREVTCFWDAQRAHGPDVEPVVLADLDFKRVISAVPIIVYAYTCHPNGEYW